MTTETSLATREFPKDKIRQRLDIAASAGFGLAGATQAQLNGIYLLAIKYDVDPLTDITLFRDKPWFTIDGRVRIMRRHPEYLGYSTRPLTKDEKDAWGYASDEIVVECTIKTRKWGEIKARGKVRPGEFANQPVAKSHPQEMAEKRAIARASRMAFGQDVPDEDEVGIIIEERNAPARVQEQAQQYVEIFGDADHSAYDLQESTSAAVDGPRTIGAAAVEDAPSDTPASPPESADASTDRDDDMEATPLQLNENMHLDAQSLGIRGIGHLRALRGWSLTRIDEANEELRRRIDAHQRREPVQQATL